MEYLLALRRKELEASKRRKEKGIVDENEGKRMLPLGLVGEMAEMDSVRWVVMRMKFSMDERVHLSSYPAGSERALTGVAASLDRATSQYRLFHPDCTLSSPAGQDRTRMANQYSC